MPRGPSSTSCSTPPRAWPRLVRRRGAAAELLRYLVRRYQHLTGSRSLRTRGRSSVRPSRPCSAPGRPRRSPTDPRTHRPRLGDGGERAGHGVRQPGRQLRHRGRVHPGSGDRRDRAPTATSWSTPGRGRRGRHPQDLAAVERWRTGSRRCAGSCTTSSGGSSATTATCSTPSSRSSRASSGCCRPGSASARAGRAPHGRGHDGRS